MMNNIKDNTATNIKAEDTLWYIIPELKLYGTLEKDQHLSTKHFIESFEDSDQWLDRLNELNIQLEQTEETQ